MRHFVGFGTMYLLLFDCVSVFVYLFKSVIYVCICHVIKHVFFYENILQYSLLLKL